jgi:hypothetical protein
MAVPVQGRIVAPRRTKNPPATNKICVCCSTLVNGGRSAPRGDRAFVSDEVSAESARCEEHRQTIERTDAAAFLPELVTEEGRGGGEQMMSHRRDRPSPRQLGSEKAEAATLPASIRYRPFVELSCGSGEKPKAF